MPAQRSSARQLPPAVVAACGALALASVLAAALARALVPREARDGWAHADEAHPVPGRPPAAPASAPSAGPGGDDPAYAPPAAGPGAGADPRGPAIPAPAISPAEARAQCVSCHRDLDPGLHAGWAASVHAARDVGCADCHGTDHSTIFSRKGHVPASICARCHEGAARAFAASGHARARASLEGDARFAGGSAAARAQCLACHDVGQPSPVDGSIGRCSACHAGHGFSIEDARAPESCARCHMGPDHPQWEAWQVSKHGVAFAATRDTARAPTCATCHMRAGDHGADPTLALGSVFHGRRTAGDPAHPAPPYPQEAIERAAFDAARARAVEGCAACHARRFAADALAGADEVKREVDRLLASAAEAIVAARAAEGAPPPLLGPGRPPDPDPLVLRFNALVMHAAPTAWKGAYHFSPAHAYGSGLAEVEREHRAIVEEARARGRRAAESAEQRSERDAGTGAGASPSTGTSATEDPQR